MRIPIVMVADKNYISQTRVAIWTMRKNTNKDVFLEVTIFCSAQLEQESRNRLVELESIWRNIKVNFYEVDPQSFSNAKVVAHVPIASFYRLIIPEVLKQDEKCLFLDGDILVNVDLQELYQKNMGDAYIAGVRDNEFLCDPDEALKYYMTHGFNTYNYVNAGVMIFNIAKLREAHLQSEFLNCMETCYTRMDQDILNKVCKRKIKLLDLSYNYFNRRKNQIVMSKSEDWKILHFAGPEKPWNNFRIRYADKWWAWAKEALEEYEYNKIYEQAKQMTKENDWSYLLERCKEEKTIIIIGYSRIGIDVFMSLKRCDIKAEILFCDNSKEKRSLSDNNITIYLVEDLVRAYPKALWINASQRRYEEINSQLKELGIMEERIIVYKKKNEAYYGMLDDAYIEYELRQLQLKSMGSLQKIEEHV